MADLCALQLIELWRQPKSATQFDDLEWESILLVLRHEQLLARYAHRFIDKGIFAELSEYAKHHLTNAKILADRQAKQVLSETDELLPILQKYSSFVIFLKGAAYTLSSSSAAKGRVYSDIDILVDKTALEKIERHLCIRGWLPEPVNDYDERYYRVWAHEIPPIRHSARGTVLDIHHNLVPLVSGKAPNIELFLTHIQKINGVSLFTPAAMTLHSAIHLFFNEDFSHGFRDLFDLYLLMEEHNSQAYWTELIVLAEKTGFHREALLAVSFVRHYFSITVPSYVEQAFKSNGKDVTSFESFLFHRVLMPKHPLIKVDKLALADFLAWARGHYLKMPIHILLFHFTVKSGRSAIEKVLGEHYFTPADKVNRR